MAKPKAAKKHIKCPQHAEVIAWADHSEPGEQPTWGDPTQKDELRPAVIFSVGFVATENDRMVELVRDMAEDKLVGARLHIMKNAIIYRKRVAVPPVQTSALK